MRAVRRCWSAGMSGVSQTRPGVESLPATGGCALASQPGTQPLWALQGLCLVGSLRAIGGCVSAGGCGARRLWARTGCAHWMAASFMEVHSS